MVEVRALGGREPLAGYAVAQFGEGQHLDAGGGAGGRREGDLTDLTGFTDLAGFAAGIMSVFDHNESPAYPITPVQPL